MTADPGLLDGIATDLAAAWRDRRPIAQLSATHPSLTPVDAYAIQQRLVAGHLSDGARIVGWKIGLTSLAMQRQLGVDQPDYGPIPDRNNRSPTRRACGYGPTGSAADALTMGPSLT